MKLKTLSMKGLIDNSAHDKLYRDREDCSDDGDCSMQSRCALTLTAWYQKQLDGTPVKIMSEDNQFNTCVAENKCSSKTKEMNGGIQKERMWFCGEEKLQRESQNKNVVLGWIIGACSLAAIIIYFLCTQVKK